MREREREMEEREERDEESEPDARLRNCPKKPPDCSTPHDWTTEAVSCAHPADSVLCSDQRERAGRPAVPGARALLLALSSSNCSRAAEGLRTQLKEATLRIGSLAASRSTCDIRRNEEARRSGAAGGGASPSAVATIPPPIGGICGWNARASASAAKGNPPSATRITAFHLLGSRARRTTSKPSWPGHASPSPSLSPLCECG
mmetsp:Transcript_15263/g.36262  ORF Transcript_15263/g.36262 Transcript_15263/m.36262 type:complete len:203 (+) Transcript_15263:1091-1699(+)